jgi:hypothetical protein
MLSGNRQDLLEDALLHAWRRCAKGLLCKLENDMKRINKETAVVSLAMHTTNMSYHEYDRLKKVERDTLLRPSPTSPLIQLNTCIQSIVCAIKSTHKDLTFSNAQPVGTLNVYNVKDLIQKLKAKLEYVRVCPGA